MIEQLKNIRGESVYSEMRVKNLSLSWMVQLGRPPAPALRWPTPSAPPERRSRWATAWTSPASTVSSWMELSRSPAVQTASGDLCPLGASLHTSQPKHPLKNVSFFFCTLIYLFFFFLFSDEMKLFCLIYSTVQGPNGHQKLQPCWQIHHNEELCFWRPGPIRVWRRIRPSWR